MNSSLKLETLPTLSQSFIQSLDCLSATNCSDCLSRDNCGWCSYGDSLVATFILGVNSTQTTSINTTGICFFHSTYSSIGTTSYDQCTFSVGFFCEECGINLEEISVMYNQILTVQQIQNSIDNSGAFLSVAVVVTVVTGAEIEYSDTGHAQLFSMIIFDTVGTSPSSGDLTTVCSVFVNSVAESLEIGPSLVNCNISMSASQKRVLELSDYHVSYPRRKRSINGTAGTYIADITVQNSPLNSIRSSSERKNSLIIFVVLCVSMLLALAL